MIRFPPGALEAIRVHARKGYPHESCGALLGRIVDGGARSVERVVPVENEREDRRERRYLISPDAIRNVEREAARDDLELIGFYHSHPDHPAEPSSYDLEQSWPWYVYLIVEVRGRKVGSVRAWRLADDRSSFVEEQLRMSRSQRGPL